MKFSVHKFGGSVLTSVKGFENLKLNIINSKSKNAVIFSAIGKTSSELRNAIYLAENNELTESYLIIDKIQNTYISLSEKILDEKNFNVFKNILDDILKECKLLLKSVSITNEVSGRTYDRFLSIGEDMTKELLKIYLDDIENNYFLEAGKIIKTDSDFTKAKVNREATLQALNSELLPIFDKYQNVFIQGFVGSDDNGTTTTMGFESSNLTATIIAEYLNADELTLWSDVDGIYSADPSEFSSSSIISQLDYKTALLSGIEGLKLIYPEMIRIAQSKNINLIYRNGNSNSDNFSVINSTQKCESTLFILKQINSEYNIEDSSITPNNYISVVIINPLKKEIIEFLINYYSINIQKGNIAILSGFRNDKMEVLCNDINTAKSIIDGLIKI